MCAGLVQARRWVVRSRERERWPKADRYQKAHLE